MAVPEWFPGNDYTVDVVWQGFEIEIEGDPEKTVSSITLTVINEDDTDKVYADDLYIGAGVTIAEEDITYVTRDDHTDELPSSIRHQNLLMANRHENGLFRTIASTGDAGTQREIAFCTGDSKFYGCTVTGGAGAATWVALH